MKVEIMKSGTELIFEVRVLAVLAPSSFEIFNFLTIRDRNLKFWQNNVLMSASFCQYFSFLSLTGKKLKISKLDGATSTFHKKFADHWPQ